MDVARGRPASPSSRVPATCSGEREVYLDYAAATPLAPEVLETMTPYLTECFYNPSAPYAVARRVRVAYEAARATLAHAIGAKPGCVVITAGATEANNLALAAADGDVLVDAAEHESVLAVAKARGGDVVGVGGDGRVAVSELAAAITPKTELVSVALANGEVGAIQPVREIAQVISAERRRRLTEGVATPLYLHTDASQAFGALAVNVGTLGADLVTLSASKIYGPKQVGLLWAADGIALRPLVRGGGQEGGVRSGTENVAGVVGFARAAELVAERRAAEAARQRRLRQRLEQALRSQFPWAVVSGPRKEAKRLPGLLHISFPGLEARRLVLLLERRGVSVGTGSACAASKMHESHVLAAMGVPPEIATGSLRVSLGVPTAEEDVAYAAAALADVVNEECVRVGVHRV